MLAVSVSRKRLQVKQVPSINHLNTRYPVLSAWENEHEGRTIAYQILDHRMYDNSTPVTLVEYLKWCNVWGWIPSGRAEWLEARLEGGEVVLYTYTDANGIEVQL